MEGDSPQAYWHAIFGQRHSESQFQPKSLEHYLPLTLHRDQDSIVSRHHSIEHQRQ